MNPLPRRSILTLAIAAGLGIFLFNPTPAAADNCRTYKTVEYRWGFPYQVTHRECSKPVRQSGFLNSGNGLSFNFFGKPDYVVYKEPAYRNYYGYRGNWKEPYYKKHKYQKHHAHDYGRKRHHSDRD